MEHLEIIYKLFSGLRKIPEHKNLNIQKIKKEGIQYGSNNKSNNRRDKASNQDPR